MGKRDGGHAGGWLRSLVCGGFGGMERRVGASVTCMLLLLELEGLVRGGLRMLRLWGVRG